MWGARAFVGEVKRTTTTGTGPGLVRTVPYEPHPTVGNSYGYGTYGIDIVQYRAYYRVPLYHLSTKHTSVRFTVLPPLFTVKETRVL